MDRIERRHTLKGRASSIASHYYPNMDLMRYVLAIAVIIAHIDYLTGFNIPFPLSSYEAVGGFFAMSGFLMYPNYIRHNNFVNYAKQRARRILPPYISIVVIAALCLCITSTLNPAEYYSSKEFYEYLGANLSFLNWLHPDLPGVFNNNEYVTPAINGSLWTMKVEWCLYFSVPLFILLQNKLKKIGRQWLVLIVIGLSIAYRLLFSYLYITTGKEIYDILRRQIFGQFSFFYAGMLIYFIKDIFIKYPFYTLITGIALKIAAPYFSYTISTIVDPFAISIIVMSVSLLPYEIKALRHRNNVSYEMYLFHFPIIQLGIFLGITTYGRTAVFIYVFMITVIMSLCVHLTVKRWILPTGRQHLRDNKM